MTTESSPNKSPLIVPGMVIELADMTELSAVEDIATVQVDPELDRDLWIARPAIKELLRPTIKGRSFNGKITDISLRVMEEPYPQLLTARERGYTIPGRDFTRRTSDDNDRGTSRYIGLEYSAALHSTGRGLIGSVNAELWYAPVTKYRQIGVETTRNYYSKSGDVRSQKYTPTTDSITGMHQSYAVLRIVTKPVFDPRPLVAADQAARRIGFDVLQAAMRNPALTPMQN